MKNQSSPSKYSDKYKNNFQTKLAAKAEFKLTLKSSTKSTLSAMEVSEKFVFIHLGLYHLNEKTKKIICPRINVQGQVNFLLSRVRSKKMFSLL